MQYQTQVVLGILTVFLISTLTLASFGSIHEKVQAQNMSMMSEESYGNTTALHEGEIYVRDSQAILLEGRTIPSQGFIHLYDSTPFVITNGHVAANIPCEDNSTASLNILIGQAPNFTAA